MNKVLTFLILVYFATNSIAQTYQPFPTSNAVWREESGGLRFNNCADYQYTITGDTNIKNLTYHKLQKTGVQYLQDQNEFCTKIISKNINHYSGCFRNDIISKRVYLIRPNDTSESLLYDFSLNIGDSLPASRGLKVKTIDSVYLNGVYHKRFSFGDCYGRKRYPIEGIGGTFGLLFPYYCHFEHGYELLCFKVNNQPIYPDNSTSCSLAKWLGQKSTSNISLSIYPNPSSNKFFIQLNNQTIKYNKLEIINSNGQKCLSMPVDVGSEPVEVNIEKLTKGLYLVKLMNEQGYIFTKMIKN
jgi:hypothetical protein